MNKASVNDRPAEVQPADLLAGLPQIERARGWRLYGAGGRRFLDMWADGGRTVAGRRTGSQGRLAKEILDRGLVSDLPSSWEGRFQKALSSWLPSYTGFHFYTTESVVLPFLGGMASGIGREKPFGSWLDEGGKTDLAFVTLPLAPVWTFAALVVRKEADFEGLPPSESIPTIKLAIATHALAEFREFELGTGESQWSRIDRHIHGLFERKGPWLLPLYHKNAHAGVFEACLAVGLLISPVYGQPSYVPGEFDEGEIAPLRKIPRP